MDRVQKITGLWGPRRRALIGLDMSSTAVKLLELAKDPRGFRVESQGIALLPSETIVGREVKNTHALGEAIKRLVEKTGCNARDAAIAVSGSAVITKIIQLRDDYTEEEREEKILSQADQYIPFPLEEINLDFAVLGPSETLAGHVDVLLAACRSENVDTRLEALELAGLSARAVDIEVYALERALGLVMENEEPLRAARVIAVIDIGALTTALHIFDNSAPLHMRSIHTREEDFGGQSLILELCQRYGMTAQEAHLALQENALPEDYEIAVYKPFAQAIARQIQRALQFFFSSSQYSFVDHLVLAGGIALMPGLAHVLETFLGPPTLVANPFVRMTVGKKISAPLLLREAPAMMLSCGLALRAFDDD